MKKALAYLIALTMLLCSLPAISFADAAEPTTVTIATTWQVPEYFGETNENKLLLEKENIILQPVFCDTEKLGLMLASGELTDIVISEYTYLSTIMTNNMAKNLDEIMEEHIPNLASDLYKTCNDLLRLQMSGGTGNLYFLVPGQGVEYAGSNDRNIRGYIVRWDLYKQIGMPEIKNDEDYVNVIAQMVEAAGGVTKSGSTLYGMGVSGTTLGDWYARARLHRRRRSPDGLPQGARLPKNHPCRAQRRFARRIGRSDRIARRRGRHLAGGSRLPDRRNPAIPAHPRTDLLQSRTHPQRTVHPLPAQTRENDRRYSRNFTRYLPTFRTALPDLVDAIRSARSDPAGKTAGPDRQWRQRHPDIRRQCRSSGPSPARRRQSHHRRDDPPAETERSDRSSTAKNDYLYGCCRACFRKVSVGHGGFHPPDMTFCRRSETSAPTQGFRAIACRRAIIIFSTTGTEKCPGNTNCRIFRSYCV